MISHNRVNEQLIKILNKLHKATFSVDNKSEIDELFKQLLDILNHFRLELLPYAAITQFVYANESEDFPYFIQKLYDLINENFTDDTNEEYQKCMKLVEHIDLAQQQKDVLFNKQEADINIIKNLTKQVMNKTDEIEDLSKKIEELQKSNEQMVSNFINILGIFAAILMGAFGAIQGFTSLYKNANNLSIGKIFIISSIGASSVILILFLLLNAIAKLTGKTLSNQENGKLLLRYPTLVITFYIIIAILLIGAAIELSKIDLQPPYHYIWWMLPLAWIIYVLCIYDKNKN